MRRSMAAITGGRPWESGSILATAAGTAALQSAGFEEWWALPVLLVAGLTVNGRRRAR